MENLKGNLAHKRLVKAHFAKIGDLLYFDGSLMTLFRNTKDNNSLYLFDWAESDETHNRWLVYGLKPIDVLSYINNELSHLNLIKRSKDLCAVDIDKDFNFHNCVTLEFTSIPLSYLPKENFFFDKENCPDLKKIQVFLDGMLVLQPA
jgi:hypothetical protein